MTLATLLATAGLAAATFVSTSLDNFTLLLGFFADDEYPRRQVVGGYLTSVAMVLAVAFGAAEAVELAPARMLGALGVIPLGMGLLGLVRLVRHAGPVSSPSATPTPAKGFLPVLLVMVANSGDSVGVFVPVFADTAEGLEIAVLVAVPACALLTTALARWLVTKSGVGRHIQRGARIVLPFLLIAIGTYILLDTGTDVVG